MFSVRPKRIAKIDIIFESANFFCIFSNFSIMNTPFYVTVFRHFIVSLQLAEGALTAFISKCESYRRDESDGDS